MDPQTSRRLTRAILPPLFGALFVLSCLALPQYLRFKNSTQWPSTTGLITVSRLQVSYFKGRKDGLKGYYGEVRYRYRVADKDYEGDKISFNRVHVSVRDAWQRALEGYPVGKTVNVFYDPKNPGIAVLEPGLHGEINLLYRMTILYIAGSGLAFLMAISVKRN
jgi:Protein of unknown function (DUF3592)